MSGKRSALLLVIVLALAVRVSSGGAQTAEGSPGGSQDSTATAGGVRAGRSDAALAEFAAFVLDDAQRTWSDRFARAGTPYRSTASLAARNLPSASILTTIWARLSAATDGTMRTSSAPERSEPSPSRLA